MLSLESNLSTPVGGTKTALAQPSIKICFIFCSLAQTHKSSVCVASSVAVDRISLCNKTKNNLISFNQGKPCTLSNCFQHCHTRPEKGTLLRDQFSNSVNINCSHLQNLARSLGLIFHLLT